MLVKNGLKSLIDIILYPIRLKKCLILSISKTRAISQPGQFSYVFLNVSQSQHDLLMKQLKKNSI